MKLSEKLEFMAAKYGLMYEDLGTLNEAAELARRFEGAASVKVRGKLGDVCTVVLSHDYCGQRVRLVPECAQEKGRE